MRYDWGDGTTRRYAKCFDRDTGEEVPYVTRIDEDAGILERYVADARGPMQIDPATGCVRRVVENRRVRILWLETEEEAEAREAQVRQYREELRAGRVGQPVEKLTIAIG